MAYIKDKSDNIITSHHNFYAVMDFQHETDLNLSDDDHSFVNTRNQYFTNGPKALNTYLSSFNEYVQLATGDTLEELKENMTNINKNINEIIKSYGLHNI